MSTDFKKSFKEDAIIFLILYCPFPYYYLKKCAKPWVCLQDWGLFRNQNNPHYTYNIGVYSEIKTIHITRTTPENNNNKICNN